MRTRILLDVAQEDDSGPLLLSCLQLEMRRLCPNADTDAEIRNFQLPKTVADMLYVTALRAYTDCVMNEADFTVWVTPLGVALSESELGQEEAPIALAMSFASPKGPIDLSVHTFSSTPISEALSDSLNYHVRMQKRRAVRKSLTDVDRVFAMRTTLAVQAAYIRAMTIVNEPLPGPDIDPKKLM